jgi:predicted ATP-dependent serine protease
MSLVGKTEKKQSICKECGAYLEGSLSKCPECGKEFTRGKKLPPRFKGTLQELSRKKAGKESIKLNQQKEWMKCLAVAAYRNTDVNSAAGHFFAVTGMTPIMAGVTPIPERSQWKILVRSLYPGFIRGKKSAE